MAIDVAYLQAFSRLLPDAIAIFCANQTIFANQVNLNLLTQYPFSCQGSESLRVAKSFCQQIIMLGNYFNNDPQEVTQMSSSLIGSVGNLEPKMVDRSYSRIPQGCEPRYARNVSFRRYYSSFEKPASIAFTRNYFYFASACVIFQINFDFPIRAVNFITDFVTKCVIWEVNVSSGCSIHQCYQKQVTELTIVEEPPISRAGSDPLRRSLESAQVAENLNPYNYRNGQSVFQVTCQHLRISPHVT